MTNTSDRVQITFDRAIHVPPPTEEEVTSLCRIGQGNDCCRYLTCGMAGFSCEKLTPMKDWLDARADSGLMTARWDGGDCAGKGEARGKPPQSGQETPS